MTCPDPFERFRGHLIPGEVEARPSPDSSELSHIYYGQMLDIKKELEKFNRLLEEVEDDEVRTRAATDTDASESGVDDPTGSTANPVVLSSRAHTVESPDAASTVAGMDATDVTEHDGPVAAESTSPVSAEGTGFPDRASDSTQSSTGDADRSWKVVEHVHDDESGQQGPVDAAPAKTDQQTTSADLVQRRERRSASDREAVKQTPVQREVPRTVPSGLPSQHVAAFDSLMKGARTALTDSHRTKPKTRPPVTVTLPSPEQLEEDLVRERGFRERFAPMVSERIEVFYDRMTSVQDGLAMLQDRMGVVVGVAAVVVLVAAGLVIVPRMLSGDGVESDAMASTASESDSVHLLSSAESLIEPESATLTVSTYPPGARVYLGSELIGVTPFQGISVDRGFQSITIKKTDYLPVDTMLTMDGSASLFFELRTDPEAQSLSGLDIPVDQPAIEQPLQPATRIENTSSRSTASEQADVQPERTQQAVAPSRRVRETSTPARSATGSLVITSDPMGATVFVDDEAVGETPLTLDEIEAGRKRITMQRDGYVPYEIEINVMPSLQTPFHAALAAMKGRIELRVAGGVDLYVDGELQQAAARTGYTAVVDVGRRAVKLVHPQYGEWTTSVDVKADETVPVEVNLEEATFAAAVQEGDRLFSESRYAEAMESYNQALVIRPGSRAVENKTGLVAKAMSESGIANADNSGVYSVADTPAELIGGLEALHANVEYPQEAYDAGVQGRVYVQFVIDEDGRVQDAKIAKGLPMGCNEAALRAVQRARFKPALVDGRPVKVRQTLFVNFTID